MGVQNLWDLLGPTGSRLEMQTLAGKRVAVDASIWLVQFIKAMRDERGEVVPNAHLLGFFRRIVRLLCNRIRPVFVFDGETPAMKRQTVAARRRQRAQADVKLKRVAEKLLLSHVKQHLAAKKGPAAQSGPGAGSGAAAAAVPSAAAGDGVVVIDADVVEDLEPTCRIVMDGDAMQADPDAEPQDEYDDGEDDDDDDDDDGDITALMLPVLADGESYDVSALASLPTSLQLQLIARMREQQSAANRVKLQAASACAPSAFSSAQLEAYIANGKVKRQLDEMIRAPPAAPGDIVPTAGSQPATALSDAMRAQRIAGDAACEFVFTGTQYEDTDDLLDDIAPLRKHKGVLPVKFPAGRPRPHIGTGPLHAILPPPLPGTLISSAASTGSQAYQPAGQVAVATRVSTRVLTPGDATHPEQLGAAASPAAAHAVGDVPEETGLAISFEVPHTEGGDPDSNAAQVDDDEWEDVDASAQPTTADASAAATARPAPPLPPFNVAEILRAVSDDDDTTRVPVPGAPPGAGPAAADADISRAQLSRRQVYARSHGFLLGRNLKEWADEDEVVPLLNAGQPAAAGHASADVDADEDLELAIARSLEDRGGHYKARLPPDQPSAAGVEHTPDGDVVVISDSDNAHTRSDEPSMVVTCHDGRTWPLTWAAFSACVDTIHRDWPPWLPMPSELDTQPVRINHVHSGAEWTVSAPVLNSLTEIRRDALALQTQTSLGQQHASRARPAAAFNVLSAQQQQLQQQQRQRGAAKGKSTVAFTSPEEVQVNGQPVAWDARWEGAAAEYRPAPAGGGHGGAGPSSHDEAQAAAEALLREEEFEAERAALRAEQRAASKVADAVTPEMYVEVQELLTMFGIPYIIAPFEAEAQCAWLEQAGLVDAVVTDDSDALLFGAKTVCRNIFEARKFVELYTADAILKRLGLSREHLTWLALLLGSDYTPGVSGVGIVHAAEIVAAFPGMDGLRRFKAWVEAPESELVVEELRGGKQQTTKAARGARTTQGGRAQGGSDACAAADVGGAADTPAAPAPGGAGAGGSGEEKEEAVEDSPAAAEFKRRHAGARKTFVLCEGFPSQAVVDAYLRPQVDTSRERFEWGTPDEMLLRHFCATRLGWPTDKAGPILAEVMRQAALRDTQRTVTSFFAPQQQEGDAFAKVRSKRLYNAIAQLTGREDPSLALGAEHITAPKRRKRKAQPPPPPPAAAQEGPDGDAPAAGPATTVAPPPPRRRPQAGQRVAEDGCTVVEPSGLGFDVAVPGSDF